MSDQGGPDTRESSARGSKRTQRYRVPQGKVEQPQKRTLLKALGIGGGAVGIGGLGLLWKTFSQPQPTEGSGQETIQYYQIQLRNLDQEILRDPQVFKEKAPQIGNLAIEYFCIEMGYDPNRFLGKIHYENKDSYQRKIETTSGCIKTNTPDNFIGVVAADSNEILLNLDAIFSSPPTPTYLLFGTVIHELFHAAPPTKIFTGEAPFDVKSNIKTKGFTIIFPVTENSIIGYECKNISRNQLEEAVVTDATERLLNKLNVAIPLTERYNLWTSIYRSAVIDRLFGGDYKRPLMLHQQTNPDEFFHIIGERLGAPSQKRRQEAQEYLVTLGIY